MNRNWLWSLTVALFFMVAFDIQAQNKPGKPAKKPEPQNTEKEPAEEAEHEKVKGILAFLEYVLNTLGSSQTPAREKDILITESYSKIFRDSKVQIEDDLDAQRSVITNKDVIAYLKDVDFFFKDVRFEFLVNDIQRSTLTNGDMFYKVSLTRNLTGTTSEGDTVNNTIPRFIEINYDPESQDLKIASIYTKGFDEKEALTSWWAELSYEWQSVFKRKLSLADSVTFSDIKAVTVIEDLDLNNNSYILNIEPLAQLLNLKLLDISHTNITDLSPIRNLTELVELNISHTNVEDLSPLRYAQKLQRLNVSHTPVTDISVLERMKGLQNLQIGYTSVTDFSPVGQLPRLIHLDLQGSAIADLSPVQHLTELMELNLAGTSFLDPDPLKGLKNLNTLNVDSTGITNLNALSGLESLKVLYANYTEIIDLQPLKGLPQLEKVYCDQTPITKDKANEFMAMNPHVLVIFDSKDLEAWWRSLPDEWQEILRNAAQTSLHPSKEELARITNLDSINLTGKSYITDLEPLRRLQKLKAIAVANTGIQDLAPLEDHRDIRYLDISETAVNDITLVSHFSKLKIFKADRGIFQYIDFLYNMPALEKIYGDYTVIDDEFTKLLLEKNPDCLVVYKTIKLMAWWDSLPDAWKKVFQDQMYPAVLPTRENLHKLVERQSLQFKDVNVADVSPLTEFINLKKLSFSATAITEIPSLTNLRSLKVLQATNGPLQKIESLSQYNNLEDVEISNTAVEDLSPIGNLHQLKTINCSGTQVKKLDPLKNLQRLEHVDCSNTLVRQLDPVMQLPLKSLKCYNTRISAKEVQGFKKEKPECEVIYY